MFFSKKEDEKEVKYQFSDKGIEELAKNIHRLHCGLWEESGIALSDINYLRGVADTLPDNSEMKAIIKRLQNQSDALRPLGWGVEKVEW